MSGFDNGTLQGGVQAQAQQFGAVLRSNGPPAPQAGVVGVLYIDLQNGNLYTKRSTLADEDLDAWGHYLFQLPGGYRTALKWFGSVPPDNTMGNVGDYYLLWNAYPNYGLQPVIYGPKLWNTGWPGAGVSVPVTVNPLYAAQDTHNV